MLVYVYETWKANNDFTFYSTGMTITSSGTHRTIQVWLMWDFLIISFGSQTFCSITGRHYMEIFAIFHSIIGYTQCWTWIYCSLHSIMEWSQRKNSCFDKFWEFLLSKLQQLWLGYVKITDVTFGKHQGTAGFCALCWGFVQESSSYNIHSQVTCIKDMREFSAFTLILTRWHLQR